MNFKDIKEKIREYDYFSYDEFFCDFTRASRTEIKTNRIETLLRYQEFLDSFNYEDACKHFRKLLEEDIITIKNSIFSIFNSLLDY